MAENLAIPRLEVAAHGMLELEDNESEGGADRPDVMGEYLPELIPMPQREVSPLQVEQPKLTVLSVAPALAEAINRIHNGESVSSLFDH